MKERSEQLNYQLPLVNIREEADRVILTAELPGVSREGLEVTVEGDEVTLTGRRPSAPESLKAIYRESSSQPYRRRFVLGSMIDRNRIEAKMDEGILELVLYKTQEETPRAIKIS